MDPLKIELSPNIETMLDGTPIKLEKLDFESNCNKNERPERNLWREIEIITMLEICKQKNIITLLNDKSLRSEQIFRMIETEMFNRRFRKKNYQQIWTKWKFLKSTYTTSKRKNVISKVISLKCYELLDKILNVEGAGDYDEFTDNENSFDVSNGNESFASSDSCSGGVTTVMVNDSNENSTTSGVVNEATADVSSCVGTMPIIANVRGGLRTTHSAIDNSCNLNGQDNLNMNDVSAALGMQHPIFGYRLGIVKTEPIDEGENSMNEELQNSMSDGEVNALPLYLPAQTEISSSPHIIPPLPPLHMAPNLPMSTRNSTLNTPPKVISINLPKKKVTKAKNCNEILAKKQKQLTSVMRIPPIPKLHFPFVKINIPKTSKVPSGPLTDGPPKVPPLRICKRKKQTDLKTKVFKKIQGKEIMNPVESVQKPLNPKVKILSSENSSNESQSKKTKGQTTYGRAIKELTVNLKEMQKDLLTEFFKKQAELVEEEHRFQRQQDEMLLKSFEEQTSLLLNGARAMLSVNFPMAPNVLYFDSNNQFDNDND